jgi:hypothetical protein
MEESKNNNDKETDAFILKEDIKIKKDSKK